MSFYIVLFIDFRYEYNLDFDNRNYFIFQNQEKFQQIFLGTKSIES